jgi:hypothetical protein
MMKPGKPIIDSSTLNYCVKVKNHESYVLTAPGSMTVLYNTYQWVGSNETGIKELIGVGGSSAFLNVFDRFRKQIWSLDFNRFSGHYYEKLENQTSLGGRQESGYIIAALTQQNEFILEIGVYRNGTLPARGIDSVVGKDRIAMEYWYCKNNSK